MVGNKVPKSKMTPPRTISEEENEVNDFVTGAIGIGVALFAFVVFVAAVLR